MFGLSYSFKFILQCYYSEPLLRRTRGTLLNKPDILVGDLIDLVGASSPIPLHTCSVK